VANKINIETEKVFRQTLYAVIKNDEKMFENQLATFVNVNELLAACARATDVSAVVIVEQYQGKPSPEMLDELAEHIAPFHEAWSGITVNDLKSFLQAMLEGVPVENVLATETAIRVPFVLAGHLLVQFQNPDEQWFDYLDRIWERIEDGDAPSD
jgi:aminoglycoside phosphotransferase family enzyme